MALQKKRKAISRAKHYFFDVGVVNALTGRSNIQLKSEVFGKAFEHFIICEVRALIALKEEGLIKSYYIVSLDLEVRKHASGITILPYQEFLKLLWSGKLF